MKAGDPRVTTVVISRDRREQLRRSLSRHPRPVVLVDNGSTDGTQDMVRTEFPHVDLVALPDNHGAPARNLGVSRATTAYVAFADDDSWWDPDAYDLCADAMDANPGLGLVAGRLLVGPDQHLDPVCRIMASSPLPSRQGVPGRPILGFVACGAVVRREAYLACGGFDEVVFFAGEEDRLAWDLAAAGWDLAYLPEAVAHHHPEEEPSRTGRQRRIVRNAILTGVMRRPWPVVARDALAAVRRGAPGIGGLYDTLPRLPAALRRRRVLPGDVETRLRQLRA